MTNRSAFLPAALLLATTAAGCLGAEENSYSQAEDSASRSGPAALETAGPDGRTHAPWRDGQWWKARLALDLGFGFLFDYEGTLVAQAGEEGRRSLAADHREFGVIDSYFDSFYQGSFDADLNPIVHGTTMRFYEWPLVVGRNWTTPFLSSAPFGQRPTIANLHVEALEDDPTRLRVRGETLDGATVDYDYDPETGWMTYFRLINNTRGRVAVSLDLLEGGLDYRGEIHKVKGQMLYQEFRFGIPFGPDELPQPEIVEVPPGFQFLEYVRLVGVFPLMDDPMPVGGGAAAATIVAPDGTQDSTTTQGFLEEHVQFERNRIEPYDPGQYKVLYALGGTAGAFVFISGFHDEAKRR